jgi:NADH-quinone oxidoreductase subunit K
MTLTLGHFLSLGAMLFALSVIGIFLNRRNLIVLLMAIELMLLAVNMNFVAFSYYLNDMHGQVFVFFILTVAAAESAIGLAILVLLFRNKSNINVRWPARRWPASSAPPSAATGSAGACRIRCASWACSWPSSFRR